MTEIIRSKARDLGFDDCRFTTAERPVHAEKFQAWLANGQHGEMGYLVRNSDKRVNPELVLPNAKSVIILATSYYDESAPVGVVAQYAQYQDYHDILAERLKSLTEFIQQLAPAEKSLWYVDTGPLLERDLAQRAGLGFAGKHTNLISRSLGNYFFISEIITTLQLAPDTPETNKCGKCTNCLTACPTQAITAPFHLDARKCISYLTIELKGSIPVELRPLIGGRIYGCDECLLVCPWNRFAREGNLMQQYRNPDFSQPDLLELLSLDDTGFKKRFRGTPVYRTKRRGLLRNVCVALGNTGDETTLPHLQKAALDHEPLIAEHAIWAIAQIQKRQKSLLTAQP